MKHVFDKITLLHLHILATNKRGDFGETAVAVSCIGRNYFGIVTKTLTVSHNLFVICLDGHNSNATFLILSMVEEELKNKL